MLFYRSCSFFIQLLLQLFHNNFVLGVQGGRTFLQLPRLRSGLNVRSLRQLLQELGAWHSSLQDEHKPGILTIEKGHDT